MDTRTRRLAPLSLTFALTLAASTASAAPFVASAPEAGIRLSLEAAGGDAVRGTLLYEGLRLPVEGVLSPRPDGFELRGFVVAEGERVPFTALRRGASVLVEGTGSGPGSK